MGKGESALADGTSFVTASLFETWDARREKKRGSSQDSALKECGVTLAQRIDLVLGWRIGSPLRSPGLWKGTALAVPPEPAKYAALAAEGSCRVPKPNGRPISSRTCDEWGSAKSGDREITSSLTFEGYFDRFPEGTEYSTTPIRSTHTFAKCANAWRTQPQPRKINLSS